MQRKHIAATIILLLLGVTACKKGEQPQDDPIQPDSGVTIYGRITVSGKPLAAVVVSDGEMCVQTDADGIYQMKSKKKNDLVFISVPAYCRPRREASTSTPQFWQRLGAGASEAERHDFILEEDPGQDNHTRIIFGDIHIYDSKSAAYFSQSVCAKLRKELKEGKYENPCGLTLGDMSWDYYWYDYDSGCYDNAKYLAQMDKTDFPVYGTVGNHDHDMKYNGQWWNSRAELETVGEDWTVMIPYRFRQGPTCYSANIGKIHYISMDNALTTDDGTGEKDGRGCVLGFTDNDLKWLKQDLSYVDASTPIVLSLHIPLSDIHGKLKPAYKGLNYYNGKSLETMLKPFAGHNLMLVLSAHTHTLYTNRVETSGGLSFVEIVNGAVCGSFWHSAKHDMKLTVCKDGTPGGYRVLQFNGREITQNSYMAMEKNDFYPFRSYDRNKIAISSNKWAEQIAISDMGTKSSANYVYINIFDWNEDWTLSVTEDGRPLTAERLNGIYDPLALELAAKGLLGELEIPAHPLFRVRASSATSTLVIKVTDPYGKSAVENMVRPKNFTRTQYENEDYSK